MFEMIPEFARPGFYMLLFIVVWILACRLWSVRKGETNQTPQKPQKKHIVISVAGVFLIMLFGILASIVISTNQ